MGLRDRFFGGKWPAFLQSAQSPEAFARRLESSRDYRAIAAVNSSDESTEALPQWKRAAIANGILRRAGAPAVEAMLEELAAHWSHDLAKVLIDSGDPRAVPLLKTCLDRGDFKAYGEDTVRRFIDKYPDLASPVEQVTCALCGTTRPVTETRRCDDKRFCLGECWARRGRVMPSGIGKDCPFYKEGMCEAGGGDNLCSLQGGTFHSCYVYGMHG